MSYTALSPVGTGDFSLIQWWRDGGVELLFT